MSFDMWGEPKKKSVPKKLLKRMVWDRDMGVCRICGRPADQFDWELGHNRARSKGGQWTYKNTFVVHPSCNRSQHTLTLKETRRIIGSPPTDEEKAKKVLNSLSMGNLKYLAKKHGIALRAKKVEGFFYDEVKPPTKRQYVNALAKVMRPNEIRAGLQDRPAPKPRKKKRKDSFWI